MEQTMEQVEIGSKAINPASNHHRDHLLNTFGMILRVLMVWVGSMMSSIGSWLVKERSFVTTGGVILFSVFFITLIIGCMVGITYERTRNGQFWMNNKSYKLIGIAEMESQKGVYVPIYKEK